MFIKISNTNRPTYRRPFWSFGISAIVILMISIVSVGLYAQEEEPPLPPPDRPVRSTFESEYLIDNQTVEVPIKGTFKFDIQHRFGTLANGYDDFYGFYSNSNIRLGLGYAPIDKLFVGIGLTKFKHLVDFNAKYSLLKQTMSGKIPISVTYYGNILLDSRPEEDRNEVYNSSDRYSYFHQILIGRRFSDWLSVQVAPSVSHYNIIRETMSHDHYAVAFGAQVGVTSGIDFIINVDQPITQHDQNNPNPNVSFGIQMATASHAFQIFLGNYNAIVPQENNFFNTRNFSDNFKDNFLIGFNITRMWVY